MPQIKITLKKDGSQVAWFRESKGRVRTSAGPVNWAQADQLRQLADYGIQLQLDQCARGLGSDGTAMPPLKQAKLQFAGRTNGRAQFTAKTLRDLRGPGRDGHMLDDVRINYLDDQRVTFGITRRSSRIKAAANERKAAWWGWSPESVQKLTAKAAELFQTGVAEHLYAMGLIGANALMQAKTTLRQAARWNRA